MSRLAWILVCAFVFSALFTQSVSTAAPTGPPEELCDGPCHGGKLPPGKHPGTIQHVIVIVQENRTPDNLFQGLPGADIQNYGYNSKGVKVVLVSRSLANKYDISHAHCAWKAEYNGGKMNGWDLVWTKCSPFTPATGRQTAFAYVPKAQVLPYFKMAETYTFADKTFQDNQGPSFPAHQYVIAGTSTDAVGSKLKAAENLNYIGQTWLTGDNCGGNPMNRVQMIDAAGNETVTKFPCFDHPTIMDLLTAKGLSWRYYNAVSGGFWSAPDAIKHLRYGPGWANVIVPETQIKTDITAGTLPAVSWVTPTAAESDHAASNNGSGPAYVASIVNAVGHSKYWGTTAIFITWDDWGGWYDHVTPVIYNSYEVGFRVPLIVVSPYARRGYISHVQHEQASILHFIESNFGLGSLGYADARADNLADCFNFMQSPTPFTTIATPGWTAQDLARVAGPSNVPPDDDF